MIQELFGVNNVSILGGERSNLLDTSPSPSPSLSSAPISATATTTTTTPTPSQNLRCPRCDSPNTKFCYYNNYNLTQPRHFCKTCRRYWTKGGALRNVPIGGGCRKNKTVAITSTAGKSSCAPGSLIKAEIGRSPLLNDFDHTELSPNPMLWPSKQNSHLLSLLRVNSNPNPNLNPNLNHNPNPGSPKEEGLMFGSSHFLTSCGLNEWALGLDPFGPLQVPNSIGLCNSYYINQGSLLGEAESNGLQELYQRLRSSTSCYSQHGPIILGHVASGGNNSALLDSAPVGGFLNNPTPYWHPTDMPDTNGTYP